MKPSLYTLLLTCSLFIVSSEANQQWEGIEDVPVNPLSISGLRQLADSVDAEFKPEYQRQPLEGLQHRVVSFQVDGLKQYAYILEPAAKTPDGGWPVLLINHGHHPNPPQYGRISSGETDRPGDYYRALPIAFARHGFMVVVPDFRGHNDSEGSEFAGGPLESNWYARDSIVAFRAVDSLPLASRKNRFMWGHSMGGAVTLRALLALRNRVKGASIWSSTTTDNWKSAVYYSLMSAGLSDNLSTEKPTLSRLISDINALPFDFKPKQGDASQFIDELDTPLSIHHSVLDLNSTPYYWSVELAGELYASSKPYHFYSYAGDKHLFDGENQARAIKRDVSFFKSLLH